MRIEPASIMGVTSANPSATAISVSAERGEILERRYQSYLNIPQLISAAEITNSDAIHPGYGFLAESAQFAEKCRACNIEFIGPSADAMKKLGSGYRPDLIITDQTMPTITGIELARKAREAREDLPILLQNRKRGHRISQIVHDSFRDRLRDRPLCMM